MCLLKSDQIFFLKKIAGGGRLVSLAVLGGGDGGSAGGGKTERRKEKARLKDWIMGFWHQMIFPVRRVWLAVYARLKTRKNDEGLLKLHDDVETCGYQDVKVMWEILKRSEAELMNHSHHQMRRKHKPFWKALVWANPNDSNPTASTTKMTNFPTFSHVS